MKDSDVSYAILSPKTFQFERKLERSKNPCNITCLSIMKMKEYVLAFFRKTRDTGHILVRYTLARTLHRIFQGEDRGGGNQPGTKNSEEL